MLIARLILVTLPLSWPDFSPSDGQPDFQGWNTVPPQSIYPLLIHSHLAENQIKAYEWDFFPNPVEVSVMSKWNELFKCLKNYTKIENQSLIDNQIPHIQYQENQI